MENIKNETYYQIIRANSKEEMESIIRESMNKLVLHGTHLHIISRFILKLQDKFEFEKGKTGSIAKRKHLNEAVILLKQINFSKLG